MVSYVNALLYGVGGLVVAGMALLVALQERLVYVPVLPGLTKSYQITPARLRLTYEDVWLRSPDGVRLHAWFIKLFPDCRGPTLLFFQENAGNIAHRLEMVRIMLQKLQCNVFMLSYRGYGASDGFPSQHGITKDAQVRLPNLSTVVVHRCNSLRFIFPTPMAKILTQLKHLEITCPLTKSEGPKTVVEYCLFDETCNMTLKDFKAVNLFEKKSRGINNKIVKWKKGNKGVSKSTSILCTHRMCYPRLENCFKFCG